METQLTPQQEAALKSLGIDTLNPMQQAAVSASRKGGDMVLLSPTGSGKTLAYLLPLLEQLREGQEGVQALVLSPSRELALQIGKVWKSMSTPWPAVSCYGGRPAMEEHRTLKEVHPALVVGTPGRINDHLTKGNIDASTIRLLVIDEFDKCLELGFQEEMGEVLSRLPMLERRYLMSATDSEEIPAFTGVEEVRRLNYLTTQETAARLSLFVVNSPDKDKLNTLYRLLCSLGGAQALVFCNYRESVERISSYLKEQKLPHEFYHGGLEQEKRERALYKFRNGSSNVLVSTDLASRGLDIPDVENIIHYHLPLNEEAFIHRNGRTARWDARGNSYLILHSEEQLPSYIKEEVTPYPLPERPGRPVPSRWVTLYIGKGKKDKLNRGDIAGFLYKKGGLGSDDLGMIDVLDHYAYVAVRRDKVKQLLMLVRNEKIKGMKTLIEEIRS